MSDDDISDFEKGVDKYETEVERDGMARIETFPEGVSDDDWERYIEQQEIQHDREMERKYNDS